MTQITRIRRPVRTISANDPWVGTGKCPVALRSRPIVAAYRSLSPNTISVTIDRESIPRSPSNSTLTVFHGEVVEKKNMTWIKKFEKVELALDGFPGALKPSGSGVVNL